MMKPFLGIDLTKNKKNDQPNGAEFLIAKPTSAMAQALDSSTEKAEQMEEKSKLPKGLRVVQAITGVVAALTGVGLLRGLAKVTVTQAYRNAPYVFWIFGVCIVIWGILKLLSMKKQKTVLGSEEGAQTFSHLDGVCEAIHSQLDVPENARKVDVLFFFYKVKADGSVKVCEKGMQLASHMNAEFHIFSDAENLYLSNLEGKYAFPLHKLQAIRTVKKHISLLRWNKDATPDSKLYKPYKLTVDQFGSVHCRRYHILELEHGGITWGIYFPCYELAAFEAVTGKKAQPET